MAGDLFDLPYLWLNAATQFFQQETPDVEKKQTKAAAKEVAEHKPAAKEASARAGSRKAADVKAPAKKAVARQTTVKAAAKKPAAKKAAATKKVASVKAPAKKAAAGKSKTGAAKPSSTKAAAKKPAVKKVPSKKTTSVKASPSKAASKKAPGKQIATQVEVKQPEAAKAPVKQSATRNTSTGQRMTVEKDPKKSDNWKKKSLENLTDADLIAMPDDEYMNETQLAFFRLRLIRLRDDILANADKTTARLRSDTVIVPDPADRATIEEEHALELRTRDRERKLLKKIDHSIARIDNGDYGYCDETGEAIGVPRLLARPTATLSLEAQQRRELRQKMFGD